MDGAAVAGAGLAGPGRLAGIFGRGFAVFNAGFSGRRNESSALRFVPVGKLFTGRWGIGLAESDLGAVVADVVVDFEAAGAGGVDKEDGLPVSMDERTELRNYP